MNRTRLTALAAAVACCTMLPFSTGVLVAAAVVVGIVRWLPRLGTQESQLASQRQRVALPLALDVLSLALEAGIAWDQAVGYAADCCTGALEGDLRVAAGRLAMGAAPSEVWQGSPVLRDIGLVVERSFRSGAAVSALLRQYADSERAGERLRRIENSRRLGTKILMPVAFLGYPAFAVLALIPTLVSTATQLDIGWVSTG